jgi:2,3-diaminopropionate biosynthesis protein SbnA
MIEDGILSVIGNTPLIRLNHALSGAPFRLYAKLEFLNPGGSVKDRAALKILKEAMETGALREGSVVIESSSGNMGIGLAQVCSIYNLRFICVVDPKTTTQNILLLKAYGAEVELVEEPDIVTGEFLQARLDRVRYLVRTTENSFWPNQYANLSNALAHHRTMQEIEKSLNGEVDFLFCAISTCGTMRGCAEYIREHSLKTILYAVDAVGSVIFGGQNTKRLIPGHGAAVIPALFQANLAAESVHVTDLECVIGCRTLARREAVLGGGSSGAVLMALEKVKHRIPPGSTCTLVLPDRGERYLDTIYSDAWVTDHFGDVSHLWKTPELVRPVEVEACATAIY